MYQIRTDLALETQEKMQEDKVELKGVRFSEEHVNKNLTISTVVIETENGAKPWKNQKVLISRSRHRIWMRRTKIITERSRNSLPKC